MANDPHRDLLPVKEDCFRANKASSEKFDYQVIGKLSRCELEDRFLRLLDEQIQIKKIANCQEEKIKRLGTKLIRLINEKKTGNKYKEPGKEAEDLHLRIMELEHENYALKDKNIVLKQQLASHSRHLSSHRFHSNHTSPLPSVRQPAPQTAQQNPSQNAPRTAPQTAPQTMSESGFDTANKNGISEVQLQEAEAHIGELNNEIKTLHNKIDYLQQNLEKNSLDNQKVKVTENIELIRLQRSLKQQSIQIASLQAQIKNSENSQKILKEELTRAYKANDEALYLLSEKQNEILNLCSKLEERNLNRLEESELKQRINDLMIERDCLKERSDFLINAIGTKSEESERIKELKQLLAEEKDKKEKLEEALEVMTKCMAKSPRRSASAEETGNENAKTPEKESKSNKRRIPEALKKEEVSSPSIQENSEESEFSFTKSKCNCSPENYSTLEHESDTDSREGMKGKTETETERDCNRLEGNVEKVKLERELQYLREMLRSQTSRCEAQQAEICRLMHELKVNESKCNETLRKLDMHLTIFERMEMRSRQNDNSAGEPVRLRSVFVPEKVEKVEKVEKLEIMERRGKSDKGEKGEISEKRATNSEIFRTREVLQSENEEKISKQNFSSHKIPSEYPLSEELLAKKQSANENYDELSGTRILESKVTDEKDKKRFVDQIFLDSSEEDFESEEKYIRKSFIKKLQEVKENETEKNSESPNAEVYGNRHRYNSTARGAYKKLSSSSNASKEYSNFQFPNDTLLDTKSEFRARNYSKQYPSEEVTISILWLKIEAESSLWKNDNVKLFFIDFTFLDVNGEETETPDSLRKPLNPDELCYFHHSTVVQMPPYRKEIFKSVINKPDMDLIVFKVVSDSENEDESNYDCEDVGVAVVSVKKFMEYLNKDMLTIIVKNPENMKETVGTLAVKLKATSNLLNF